MIFENGFTIKIAQDRCLNQRHQLVECKHCVENCPSDALFIHDSQVYLHKGNCSGCGVCLSECPTQVFSSGQWDETTIIKNVQYHQWETTKFFCANHDAIYNRTEEGSNGAVQIPACLSSISRGTWFELGLLTAIELQLDQCENCPMNSSLSRLEYNINVTTEWLSASGNTPKFSFISETENRPKRRKSQQAVRAGVKATKRRDFLVSLANFAQDAMRSTYSELSKETLLQSCLPDWWKRFAESFTQNMTDDVAPTYWPVIEVNDDCVSCGVCSDFCPSKTLESIEEGGVWTLNFSSGLCLDCRICQMTCPKDAIIRDRKLVENPFDVIEVISREVSRCERCGDMFPKDGNKFCHWCMEEFSLADSFNQICKEIFLISENSDAD